MPTRAEQDELREKCNWTWTTLDGKSGYKVTSKSNGNSIFLPAAGFSLGTDIYYAGSDGLYLSSSLDTRVSSYAYYIICNSRNVDWMFNERYHGRSVRPVCP